MHSYMCRYSLLFSMMKLARSITPLKPTDCIYITLTNLQNYQFDLSRTLYLLGEQKYEGPPKCSFDK